MQLPIITDSKNNINGISNSNFNSQINNNQNNQFKIESRANLSGFLDENEINRKNNGIKKIDDNR